MTQDITKRLLRQQMRDLLHQMSADEIAVQNADIMEQIKQCEAFNNAVAVLLFCPMADEPQIQALIEETHTQKQLYLPVVCGSALKVGHCMGIQKLHSVNVFGIPEPEALPQVPLIDLAIIPGLAFDHSGNRLGRGKGYYDRFLQTIDAYKIGVCYDFQYLPHIPHTDDDIKMDKIIHG
jgi:5-formyltetrahydrofolate cyclo-ligase